MEPKKQASYLITIAGTKMSTTFAPPLPKMVFPTCLFSIILFRAPRPTVMWLTHITAFLKLSSSNRFEGENLLTS